MFVLAATPGPAFFAVTTRAMTGGTLAGMGMVVGVILGDLIYFSLALYGMAKIAETMGDTFIWIKLAGGAYLFWMGFKLWFQTPAEARETQSFSARGFLKGVVEGLIVNLANPKAIIFFAAIVPSFVDLANLTGFDTVILISIITIVGLLTDGFYVFLAAKARNFFSSQKAQIRLNRIGGATLATIGVAIASR